MNFSTLLTILGSTLFLFSFIIYNKNIIKGESKPNIASWGLFIIITGINSFSYVIMSGDIIKSGLAFTDFFTCVVILILSLFYGNFLKLEKIENWAIGLTFIAIILWIMFSATHGNLFLQIGYILAFVPTFKNAFNNKETILPWFLWAIAMLFSVIVVLLRWNNQYQDLINPLIAFLLHSGVALIAWKTYKKQKGEFTVLVF